MVSALELLDFLRKGLMTDFASDEELHGMYGDSKATNAIGSIGE